MSDGLSRVSGLKKQDYSFISEENPYQVSSEVLKELKLNELIYILSKRVNGLLQLFRTQTILRFNNLDLSPLAEINSSGFWDFINTRLFKFNILNLRSLKKIDFSNSILNNLNLQLSDPIDNYFSMMRSVVFDFSNSQLSFTDLSSLPLEFSRFRNTKFNHTNIQNCYFKILKKVSLLGKIKTVQTFRGAVLQNIKIGRGIFLDGTLTSDRKKIQDFFKSLGATLVSFDQSESLHRSPDS